MRLGSLKTFLCTVLSNSALRCTEILYSMFPRHPLTSKYICEWTEASQAATVSHSNSQHWQKHANPMTGYMINRLQMGQSLKNMVVTLKVK